jgi:hypothetical protein
VADPTPLIVDDELRNGASLSIIKRNCRLPQPDGIRHRNFERKLATPFEHDDEHEHDWSGKRHQAFNSTSRPLCLCGEIPSLTLKML